jgi:enoyl-CoA hydratase
MAYENLLYDVKGAVARITFNRPHVLNALSRKTMDELDACIRQIRRDDAIRAIIFTGAGDKAFIAGADINELARQTPIGGREFSLYGQAVLRQLETLGKPSIAAINGYALGGGFELALACTCRIAVKSAKLGLPEVKLGILPGYGGTQRLARLCGRGVASQLVLTGDMITAAEAARVCLLNQVVETRAELIPAAEELAAKINANAPMAVKFSLELIDRGLDMPQEEALHLEATLFGLLCATEDMREGTRAFLDKRPPQFKNR